MTGPPAPTAEASRNSGGSILTAVGRLPMAESPDARTTGSADHPDAARSAPAAAGGASEPGGTPRNGPGPGWPQQVWRRVRHFLALTYEKAGEDDIFFIAGAISFNIIVATVPMLLAVLAIGGTILRVHSADPGGTLERLVLQNLPPLARESRELIRDWLDNLIAEAPRLIGIGTVIFVWLATRLIGTLRSALREIFDLDRDRGIIAGKIFDFKIVVITGLLFAVNVTLTLGLRIVARAGINVLGLLGAGRGQISLAQLLFTRSLAFAVLWATFLLIYRYLPARHTSWRTSITAASFTAVCSEVLKEGFSLYVTHLANYESTYGNLATLVVLVLWIYYTSVVFVLGGEVAQVAAMQRIRRRQKERLG